MSQLKFMDQPLIAITTGGAKHFPRQPELYLKAMGNAGAVAVFIGPDVSVIDAVTRYAGFIIPGGGDIDPLLYNEKRSSDLDLEYERRVNFDLALFHAAIQHGKPVLGICYGMQLINVAMGGTLYLDISTQKEGAINHREGIHQMQVDNNPFAEVGQYEINSSHHQAVKETGRGLKPFAFSPDGVIEAFYSPDYHFLMGVQWHPERMSNEISEKVFKSFIEACREKSVRKTGSAEARKAEV